MLHSPTSLLVFLSTRWRHGVAQQSIISSVKCSHSDCALQVEDPKKALLLYGNKTSQVVKDVLSDFAKLKAVRPQPLRVPKRHVPLACQRKIYKESYNSSAVAEGLTEHSASLCFHEP